MSNLGSKSKSLAMWSAVGGALCALTLVALSSVGPTGGSPLLVGLTVPAMVLGSLSGLGSSGLALLLARLAGSQEVTRRILIGAGSFIGAIVSTMLLWTLLSLRDSDRGWIFAVAFGAVGAVGSTLHDACWTRRSERKRKAGAVDS